MKTLFEERQKFDQWWLKAIITIPLCIALIAVYFQLIKGQPFGSKPISNVGVILFLVITVGIYFLIMSFTLITRIDQKVIFYHFKPLSKKTIPWSEVDTAEVLDYGFVGGWGIRIGTKYGTVYNIKGSKGLALKLKSGKTLVIGTQKESELVRVIKQCMSQSNI